MIHQVECWDYKEDFTAEKPPTTLEYIIDFDMTDVWVYDTFATFDIIVVRPTIIKEHGRVAIQSRYYVIDNTWMDWR